MLPIRFPPNTMKASAASIRALGAAISWSERPVARLIRNPVTSARLQLEGSLVSLVGPAGAGSFRSEAMPAGADEPFNSDIAPYCRSRHVTGLRCGSYTNPPFSAVRRQGLGTNGRSGLRFRTCCCRGSMKLLSAGLPTRLVQAAWAWLGSNSKSQRVDVAPLRTKPVTEAAFLPPDR